MLIYWLWLSSRTHISDREKLQLLEQFGSAQEIYLSKEPPKGLSDKGREAFLDKDLEGAERLLSTCTQKKIRILTWQDAMYPARLRNIADPPLVLYYRGQLPDFDNQVPIGVVGTRSATAYGMHTAKLLGGEIAACGGLVVSGMAVGIDAMATQGALLQGKPAVGILGCGVDVVYPLENRRLYQMVEQQGCLLSEFPPGARPTKWNFPKRNRLISGLSCGVLVVEAPERSGALITARQAMDQGRDVFVVPGNIGVAACAGSNALMKDGAIVVTSGWDVLEEYAPLYPGKLKKETAVRAPYDKKSIDKEPSQPYIEPGLPETADDTQKMLLRHLTGRQLADALIAKAGVDPSDALAAMTLLEVQGLIRTLPGGWVERVN